MRLNSVSAGSLGDHGEQLPSRTSSPTSVAIVAPPMTSRGSFEDRDALTRAWFLSLHRHEGGRVWKVDAVRAPWRRTGCLLRELHPEIGCSNGGPAGDRLDALRPRNL